MIMNKSIVCLCRLEVNTSPHAFSKLDYVGAQCVERWHMIFIFGHLNVTLWVINILLIDIYMAVQASEGSNFTVTRQATYENAYDCDYDVWHDEY